MNSLVRFLPLVLLALGTLTAFVLTPYQALTASYVMMYSIVCIGLVIMTGTCGMVSLGQAAFVGIGAYSTAWVTTSLGLSVWIGLVASLLVTGAAAFFIGIITVRMSGHYLALATLCFSVSVYFLLGNSETLGGFNGIASIPPLSFLSWQLKGERANFMIALAVLVLCVWWTRRILNSRNGRVLRSLRTGDEISESFGANSVRHRLLAFMIAAMLAGLSGWLYAHVQRFINPTPFGIHMSIEYLFMTVIGGSNQILGAIMGAGVVVLVKQELLELLQPIFGATTRLEMLFFAVVMLLILARARSGLIPLFMKLLPRPSNGGSTVGPALFPFRKQRPPKGTIVLEARDMRRTFGGLTAVDNVSLDVRAGEILGLLGPNGAGKSTLFNLLSGTLSRTSGTLRFMGEELGVVDRRRMCELGMARTFQHVKLVPNMSVLENVAIGATHLGKAGVVRASLCLDLNEERRLLSWAMYQLDRVGLSDYASKPAGSLALGHQRLVEIARALAADPILLVLDEPAAGLRPNEKDELARLLLALRGEGLAVVLVEHDMTLVNKVVDRLMVMCFGKEIAKGAPEAVRQDRKVQEAYLGVEE